MVAEVTSDVSALSFYPCLLLEIGRTSADAVKCTGKISKHPTYLLQGSSYFWDNEAIPNSTSVSYSYGCHKIKGGKVLRVFKAKAPRKDKHVSTDDINLRLQHQPLYIQ
jgi:hypothetical protein